MLKIKPVKTEFSTYDLLDVQAIEVPFTGAVIKSVTLYNSNEIANLEPKELIGKGTTINTFFSSLGNGKFAFNPESLCKGLLPQLEDQDVIKKVDTEDLHSGMISYPVYKITVNHLARA